MFLRGWEFTPFGWRSLYQPGPCRDEAVGFGCPNRTRPFRLEGSQLASSNTCSCTCMETFPIQGLDVSFPKWCWLLAAYPISIDPVEMGRPHRAGQCPAGKALCSFPECRLLMYVSICDAGGYPNIAVLREFHEHRSIQNLGLCGGNRVDKSQTPVEFVDQTA